MMTFLRRPLNTPIGTPVDSAARRGTGTYFLSANPVPTILLARKRHLRRLGGTRAPSQRWRVDSTTSGTHSLRIWRRVEQVIKSFKTWLGTSHGTWLSTTLISEQKPNVGPLKRSAYRRSSLR